MGNVNGAPFFVYVPFIAFAFIFVFMLALKLYIILSSRGVCKRVRGTGPGPGTHHTDTFTTTMTAPVGSSTVQGAYPIFSYDGALPFSYPVMGHQSMPATDPNVIPHRIFPDQMAGGAIFTSGVPPPVLPGCVVNSTSFLPPPPPYSQHDRYPPVELPSGSRIQSTRSLAKAINDIPPVE